MKTVLQLVSPEQAAAWLHADVNTENRGLRAHHVAHLAREISEGRWLTTHQGIAFSPEGRLLDGQHRLAAIVRAGKSVAIMVTTGLTKSAFAAIDGGLKRANFERIHLVDDVKQNKVICQAIRSYLVEIRRDRQISVGHIEEEFLGKTEAWMWVGSEFWNLNSKLRKAGVLASFGIYRYSKPEMAEEFAIGYRDGSGLNQGSPILRLRNSALVGGTQDCSYWRCQSIMRQHMQGRSIQRHVYEAAEDMVGNKNIQSLIEARREHGLKSAQSRKAKNGGTWFAAAEA